MLVITAEDAKQILHFAALSAAYKLRIKNAESKAVSQLVADIRAQHRGLADALDAYMSAYHEWYAFHVRIDKQGKQGQLDPEEERELYGLIGQREKTREAFIHTLAGVSVTP